jgi:hypothetical protein
VVYAGPLQAHPMGDLLDLQVQPRVGRIMPLLVGDEDPLDVEGLKTHTMPLGYEIFQKKQDGAIKVVLKP